MRCGQTGCGATGRIAAICVSERRGEHKLPVEEAELVEDYGLRGDAHAERGSTRQVSLLEWEAANAFFRDSRLAYRPGIFAENIVVSGLALRRLSPGDRLRLGEQAIVEITQRGKQCHSHCRIFEELGRCLMPEQGLFARVITGGSLKVGDKVVPEKRPPVSAEGISHDAKPNKKVSTGSDTETT